MSNSFWEKAKRAVVDGKISEFSIRAADLVPASRKHNGNINLRTLTTDSNPRGGYAVAESQLNIVGALYDNSLLAELGAQYVRATGDERSVRVVSGTSFHWLSQTGTCLKSSMTVARGNTTPHRLQAIVPVSQQLLTESAGAVQEMVLDDLRRAAGEAIDLGGLLGTDFEEPLGIFEDTRISTVTFSGAATVAKLESFSSTVRNNRVLGPLAWIVSPDTASKWRSTVGVAGVSTLFQAAEAIAPVRETALLEGDNRVALGAWQNLHVAEWKDGLDVLIDPYSRKAEGIVEMSLSLYVDFIAERPAAFAISTDAGNQ